MCTVKGILSLVLFAITFSMSECVASSDDPANASPKVQKAEKPAIESTEFNIRVVDEDGRPLSKFQAMIHAADNKGDSHWYNGADGNVVLGPDTQFTGSPLEVLVRADGYASNFARFPIDMRDKLKNGEATVTLKKGKLVQIKFNVPDQMKWPTDMMPEVYFDNLQARMRMRRLPANRKKDVAVDLNTLNLQTVSDGRFDVCLVEETPRFHVAIHSPGFLQCFEVGPFTMADVQNGKLEIDIPLPSAIEVTFEPGENSGADLPFKGASLDLLRKLKGNSMINVTSVTGASLTPRLQLNDLPPGDYVVSARTQPKDEIKSTPGTRLNVGIYTDRKSVTLKSGETEHVDFRSTPFDPDAFKGDRTALLRVRKPDGEPAVDRKASVTFYDGHYGSINVFSGVIPASGEIALEGITDAILASSPTQSRYTLSIDDRRVGAFGFDKEPQTQKFDFFLPPGVGDKAPDLQLTNLVTGQEVRLNNLRGKVVYLEFWATWCGPCQQPMAELSAVCEAQSTEWKDRVAVVCVGIDTDSSKITAHVKQKGWIGIEPYHSGGTKGSDFEAPAALAFVVNGIPDAVLIGRDGRILWRGHPADKSDGKDVASRIEDALK